MTQPHVSTSEDRAYPFPWTMPADNLDCSVPTGLHKCVPGVPGQLIRHDDVIEAWLREFRDERTGGYSPPPMS